MKPLTGRYRWGASILGHRSLRRQNEAQPIEILFEPIEILFEMEPPEPRNDEPGS